MHLACLVIWWPCRVCASGMHLRRSHAVILESRHLVRLPVDSLRHFRQDICHYGGIPPTRPSLGTLFRIDEFGKRAGRGGACDPRGWRSIADCCPAMVADWFRPLGLRLHDAIRRARSNARRPGVSNRLLQLFRQHSWDVTKMSLIDSVHRGPQSLGVRENCR